MPSVFRQWMPQDVCEFYDHLDCPELDEGDEE